MPQIKDTDLITDQEMAFARLVLAGTMNDREAAQSAGLDPDTAAYVKSKPCVRAYMLGHSAAVQQQLDEQSVAQQAEEQRQLNQRRKRFLDRLWAIADTSPEVTRGSFTGQAKALSMIGAMDGFLPGSSSPQRAAASPPASPPPEKAKIYQAAWLRDQQEKTNDPGPSPEPAQEKEPGLADSEPPHPSAGAAPPLPGVTPAINLDPTESSFVNRVNPGEMMPPAPGAKVPFFKKKKFGRRR